MKEIERTFLAKSLPDLSNLTYKELIDIYIPEDHAHPTLRIRKRGNIHVITKKEFSDPNDMTTAIEQTIPLRDDEFKVLSSTPGKKVHKIRYDYTHNGMPCTFDIFQGALKGLVLVEFEFPNKEECDAFQLPDFCLSEVTSEEWRGGGYLCGKTIDDIQHNLDQHNYKVL